jgi:hypothetical protein
VRLPSPSPPERGATVNLADWLACVQIFVERDGKAFKLSLIDLAGSERALSTDVRTKRSAEGAHINKSLLALCECINALVQGKKHVPYRNSKLTQLLKDSLSGGCKTVRAPNSNWLGGCAVGVSTRLMPLR